VPNPASVCTDFAGMAPMLDGLGAPSTLSAGERKVVERVWIGIEKPTGPRSDTVDDPRRGLGRARDPTSPNQRGDTSAGPRLPLRSNNA